MHSIARMGKEMAAGDKLQCSAGNHSVDLYWKTLLEFVEPNSE